MWYNKTRMEGSMSKQQLKISIAIISLIICIAQVANTYAKYIESKEGNTDFTVAGWKILINDQDITTGAELSSLINPVYESNSNVASGVIAPGSEGYFDIEIDATNTEVSFNYNISITPSVQSDVSDLVVSGYKIGNGQIVQVQNGLNNLTNTIHHDDSNKVIELRVYFEWKEGQGEQMNNIADTNAAINEGTGKLAVRASFTQIAN